MARKVLETVRGGKIGNRKENQIEEKKKQQTQGRTRREKKRVGMQDTEFTRNKEKRKTRSG